MTTKQRKEHKLGNAKRAYAKTLKGFHGAAFTFRKTIVGGILYARVLRRIAALSALFILFLGLNTFGQTTYTTNSSGQVFVTEPVSTNSASPGGGLLIIGEEIVKGFENASNYAIVPFASYGLDNHKFGGGVLALYNFNQFIGAGIGGDYFGQLSTVSANVQLQLPLKPLQFTGWAWATNLVLTPFVFTGLGTPMSGAGANNGGVATIIGAGDYVQFGHLLGGRFNVGGAYTSRTGAGAYSGKYIDLLFAYSRGF